MKSGTKIATAVNAFARLTRDSQFSDQLRDSIEPVVKERFSRRLMKRPDCFKEASAELFAELFQSKDADVQRSCAQGKEDSAYMQSVRELVGSVSLGAPNFPEEFPHYCYVEDLFIIVMFHYVSFFIIIYFVIHYI